MKAQKYFEVNSYAKQECYSHDDFIKFATEYAKSLQGKAITEEEIHLMRVFVSYVANSYKMINNKTTESMVYKMIQSRGSELNEKLPKTQ